MQLHPNHVKNTVIQFLGAGRWATWLRWTTHSWSDSIVAWANGFRLALKLFRSSTSIELKVTELSMEFSARKEYLPQSTILIWSVFFSLPINSEPQSVASFVLKDA